jgi:signal transduction histidine kinase
VYLAGSREAQGMLLRNLTRACELVSSFKQVAVDQTSSKRRVFDLATMVNEVLMTLSQTLRLHGAAVQVRVPPGIALDNFPGPLEQVLTNLIHNALVHAHEPGQPGHLDLAAREIDVDFVELKVSDDGQGIAPENLGRVFDPFFTTRLGQGGSGLGLSIVYNIMTGMVGGDIAVQSEPGKGATFVLTIPRVAPHKRIETHDAAAPS